MTATLPAGDPAAAPPATAPVRIRRFDRVERALHWVNAALVLTLLFTGLAMYFGPVSGWVGHRATVERIHLICGLALPVPFVLVLAGRWRRGFVADARRLGRFLPDDWRWLRRSWRLSGRLRIGKFNGGQKLNAVLVAATLPVMLMTGALMEWYRPFADSWRTGATFVHDWGFLLLLVLTIGHIGKALIEPTLLRSMVRGWVPAHWAARERPRWHDEVVAAAGPADPAPGTGPAEGSEPLR